jgi:hypothetical protein
MISQRKRFFRRGSLLAQQLLLIAISGMLMMLAIKLIHQTLDFASVYQGRFNDQRTISRLFRDFRSDVHSARTTNLIEPTRLELETLTGSRIVYRIENEKIIREVRDTGTQSNDQQQPQAFDSYRLGDNQSASLSIQSELVTLIVDTNAGTKPDTQPLPHKRLMIRSGSISASKSTPNETTEKGVSDDQ